MKTPKPMNKASPCPGCFRFSGLDCPLVPEDQARAAPPGQIVSRRFIFRQGAAALLPPVLGFAAGFTLTGFLFPLSGENIRIGAGAALMFLLALGIYLFRRPSPESS
jgi:hypothetical protein